MVANVGDSCDASSVSLEMGDNHDEYFRGNPANCGIVAVEVSADHR